jgi:hypothetical protein
MLMGVTSCELGVLTVPLIMVPDRHVVQLWSKVTVIMHMDVLHHLFRTGNCNVGCGYDTHPCSQVTSTDGTFSLLIVLNLLTIKVRPLSQPRVIN